MTWNGGVRANSFTNASSKDKDLNCKKFFVTVFTYVLMATASFLFSGISCIHLQKSGGHIYSNKKQECLVYPGCFDHRLWQILTTTQKNDY